MNDFQTAAMPLMSQPLAHLPELEKLGAELRTNVSTFERAATGVAGLVLMAIGTRWRRPRGWLQFVLGAAMLVRGIGGHCPLYYRLGFDTRH